MAVTQNPTGAPGESPVYMYGKRNVSNPTGRTLIGYHTPTNYSGNITTVNPGLSQGETIIAPGSAQSYVYQEGVNQAALKQSGSNQVLTPVNPGTVYSYDPESGMLVQTQHKQVQYGASGYNPPQATLNPTPPVRNNTNPYSLDPFNTDVSPPTPRSNGGTTYPQGNQQDFNGFADSFINQKTNEYNQATAAYRDGQTGYDRYFSGDYSSDSISILEPRSGSSRPVDGIHSSYNFDLLGLSKVEPANSNPKSILGYLENQKDKLKQQPDNIFNQLERYGLAVGTGLIGAAEFLDPRLNHNAGIQSIKNIYSEIKSTGGLASIGEQLNDPQEFLGEITGQAIFGEAGSFVKAEGLAASRNAGLLKPKYVLGDVSFGSGVEFFKPASQFVGDIGSEQLNIPRGDFTSPSTVGGFQDISVVSDSLGRSRIDIKLLNEGTVDVVLNPKSRFFKKTIQAPIVVSTEANGFNIGASGSQDFIANGQQLSLIELPPVRGAPNIVKINEPLTAFFDFDKGVGGFIKDNRKSKPVIGKESGSYFQINSVEDVAHFERSKTVLELDEPINFLTKKTKVNTGELFGSESVSLEKGKVKATSRSLAQLTSGALDTEVSIVDLTGLKTNDLGGFRSYGDQDFAISRSSTKRSVLSKGIANEFNGGVVTNPLNTVEKGRELGFRLGVLDKPPRSSRLLKPFEIAGSGADPVLDFLRNNRKEVPLKNIPGVVKGSPGAVSTRDFGNINTQPGQFIEAEQVVVPRSYKLSSQPNPLLSGNTGFDSVAALRSVGLLNSQESSAKPKTANVPRSKTFSIPKVNTKLEPRSDLRLQPKSDLRLLPKNDLRLQPKSDLRLQPKTDLRTNTKLDLRTDTKLDLRTDLRTDQRTAPFPFIPPTLPLPTKKLHPDLKFNPRSKLPKPKKPGKRFVEPKVYNPGFTAAALNLFSKKKHPKATGYSGLEERGLLRAANPSNKDKFGGADLPDLKKRKRSKWL